MADLFNKELSDEAIQLAAIQSLARITQVTLAYLNAVAYMQSAERILWNRSVDRAIKENAESTRESLWFALQDKIPKNK